MSYKVFVSHSSESEDLPLINQLANHLQVSGIECYVALWFREPGRDIGEKIRSAIQASDAVFGIWTKGGSQAQWVNQELGFAEALGKPIVLLVEQGVRVKGFAQNREYISFDRNNPVVALSIASTHFTQKKKQKESAQVAALVGLAAAGIIGGLLAWKYHKDRHRDDEDDDE